MLGKLFSRSNAAAVSAAARKATAVLPGPDISRVLKPSAELPPNFADFSTGTLGDQAEQAVDSLSAQFEGWMRRDLEVLRDTWVKAQQSSAMAEDYRRLYTAAHNISGAAPSYGFPAVARLGRSLCALLSHTKPGENTPLINLHVEACRAAIAAGAEGEASHSVADAVCDALERRVATKIQAA
jgi:HPt (histidine-containing phosphotransfer) domain-containing protein